MPVSTWAGGSRVPTLICHCDPVLDTKGGNLVAVAMMVRRRALSLNEIATWFDRLTMSGCAPRNDRWGVGALRNDSRPVWFDKVGTHERPAAADGAQCRGWMNAISFRFPGGEPSAGEPPANNDVR